MIRRWGPLALALLAGPAMAVGLGPLSKSGITDGPGKAFYLTVMNPYPRAARYVATPLGLTADVPVDRVTIFPADMTIGSGGHRQILVIVRGLSPGETYRFRVCAEAPPHDQEIIHARVCSKLAARRLPERVHVPGLGAAGSLPARPAERPGG